MSNNRLKSGKKERWPVTEQNIIEQQVFHFHRQQIYRIFCITILTKIYTALVYGKNFFLRFKQ